MKIRYNVVKLTATVVLMIAISAHADGWFQYCDTDHNIDSDCPDVTGTGPDNMIPTCDGGSCVKHEYDGSSAGSCTSTWVPFHCTTATKTLRVREYNTVEDCYPGSWLGSEGPDLVCYCGAFGPAGPWHNITAATCD